LYGRDYAQSVRNKPQKPCKSKFTSVHKVSTLSTNVNNVNTSVNSSDVKPRYSCIYCKKQGHTVDRCYSYEKLSLDEKLKIVNTEKLCYSCLKQGHISSNCTVSCKKCNRRHNVLLHDSSRDFKTGDLKNVHNVNESQGHVTVHTMSTGARSKVCLSVLPVIVQGNNVTVKTYALIDSGSNASLCKRSLFEKLNM
jgi:hypothetical protein